MFRPLRPRRPPASVRLPGLFLLVLLLLVSAPWAFAEGDAVGEAASSDEPRPRPISAAERRAVELLVDYLDEGADSWWPAVAAGSPLEGLGREALAKEIAVRLGPRRGSHFILQTPGSRHGDEVAFFQVEFPSGLDDTFELVFVEEDGEPKLYQLRSSADPRPSTETFRDLLDDQAAMPAPPSGPHPSPAALTPATLVAVMFAGVLLVLGLPASPRRHRRGAFLAAAGLACSILACSSEPEAPASSEAEVLEVDPRSFLSLASLGPLRDALTGGDAELDFDQLAALVPRSVQGEARQSARAWTAQILLTSGRLAQAEKVLQGLPSPASRPLVELLRGRLAVLQARADEVVDRYDRALVQAPDADHLRVEAAYSAMLMGHDDPARISFEMLVRTGSRLAEAWYVGTALAILEERMDEAERRFRVGYGLKPISREDLFEDLALSYVATRPGVFPLFRLDDANEPRLAPSGPAGHPLSLPQGATAVSLGDRLEISLGGSRLTLLGAADLTPGGIRLENAAEAKVREEEATLSRLDELKAAARRPGGLAHPARLRQARVAAAALAQQRRWDDLLELTDLGEDGPTMPPDLVKLRARALLEAERDVEGKNLLIQLAQSDLANRRRDPGTLYQLAEMFVATGEYDLALKLIRKANSMSPQKVSPRRIRQIEMDRELESSFATYESDHFVLRYPSATGEKYPRQLSWVLEAEWQRLQHWIPVTSSGKKVEIHLFELEKFMRAFSGGVTVLGLYDGKVRVPLADLKSFHPLLVNIVSHEVAHAMIDLATEGHAPKWFHEGLASHVEMDQKGINPLPDMHAAGRDLSFAIMEPVLAGFSEPQLVELAYSHSTWALHYVEARHGVSAIHRLLRAFKSGKTTEEVLEDVLGQSVQQFDESLRRWAVNDAPTTWPTQLVRYDRQFDRLIERDTEPELAAQTEPRRYAMPGSRSARAEAKKAEAARPDKPAAQPTRRGDPAARFKAWHTRYARATRPVKATLGQTLALYTGKKQGDLHRACRQLSRDLETLLGDQAGSLRSPSESVSNALTGAYRSFDLAARACQRTDRRSMQKHLDEATRQLGEAHGELKRYGLRP